MQFLLTHSAVVSSKVSFATSSRIILGFISFIIYLAEFMNFPFVLFPTSLVPTKHGYAGSSAAGITIHSLPIAAFVCFQEKYAVFANDLCKHASPRLRMLRSNAFGPSLCISKDRLEAIHKN